MERKLILCRLGNRVVTAVLENGTVAELHVDDLNVSHYHVGDIYIGRVKNIVKNIQAAFIEIQPGVECYYRISDNPDPVFTKKLGKKPLCIGDELLVQIEREAVKTKVPTVTSNLNLTGKYAVLTHGNRQIGVSAKLPKELRQTFKDTFQSYAGDAYGFIIRTNAAALTVEELGEELDSLRASYEQLTMLAMSRTCFTCMKQSPREYLTELRNIYQDDPLLPLHKLYSVEHVLQEALKERVWMKSGAYLVIQPTEALTVIDVNSGKCVLKKADSQAFYKINKEAAREAARQIRLRNLSGIILIDFINMKDEMEQQELLNYFSGQLKADPVRADVVDMTKLQLVEVTRRKVRKPLHEAWPLKRSGNYE